MYSCFSWATTRVAVTDLPEKSWKFIGLGCLNTCHTSERAYTLPLSVCNPWIWRWIRGPSPSRLQNTAPKVTSWDRFWPKLCGIWTVRSLWVKSGLPWPMFHTPKDENILWMIFFWVSLGTWNFWPCKCGGCLGREGKSIEQIYQKKTQSVAQIPVFHNHFSVFSTALYCNVFIPSWLVWRSDFPIWKPCLAQVARKP